MYGNTICGCSASMQITKNAVQPKASLAPRTDETLWLRWDWNRFFFKNDDCLKTWGLLFSIKKHSFLMISQVMVHTKLKHFADRCKSYSGPCGFPMNVKWHKNNLTNQLKLPELHSTAGLGRMAVLPGKKHKPWTAFGLWEALSALVPHGQCVTASQLSVVLLMRRVTLYTQKLGLHDLFPEWSHQRQTKEATN